MPAVGVLADYFGFGRRADVLSRLASPESARRRYSIRPPWAAPHAGNLPQVMAEEILGIIPGQTMTRDAAMRVPAAARARHLIVSTIAQMPLVALDKTGPLPEQPPFLQRTNGQLSPQLRTAWTVDDLIWHGMSLWAVNRGAGTDGGRILDAWRIPMEDWRLDEDLRILVLEAEVDPASVVLFTGLHEGVLLFGRETLATAAELELTVTRRVSVPLPLVELHQTTDDELDDDEIDDLIDAYVRARADPKGAVMYTPSSVETKVHGEGPIGDALIQARNSSAIDVARSMGLPASMIDASNVNASLTYETTAGRGLEFQAYTLALYTAAIEARLSLDDCVPRGTRVRFDAGDLTNPAPLPTGPITED